jgi:hypothetical protein
VVVGQRQQFQPDVAVLRRRDDDYASRRPGPADTFVVAEVADTTFALDRSLKVPRSAAAGVPEVWLADLRRDVVLVSDTPASDACAGWRWSAAAKASHRARSRTHGWPSTRPLALPIGPPDRLDQRAASRACRTLRTSA